LVFSKNTLSGLDEASTPDSGGSAKWSNTVKLGVVAEGGVSVPNWLF
jgi:hypothetical protein